MNSIVISLGGLRVRYLGCYGGASVETPAFDRFASEGFTFDECFLETPSPAATRQAWWTARYQNFRNPDEPAQPGTGHPCLIRAIRAVRVRTVLVRDSSALVENSRIDSARFDQIIEIDRADEDSTSRVFEAAKRWLARESSKGQFLLFIDCHGAHQPWYPPQTPDESDAELEAIETEQPVDEDADASVAIDSIAPPESSDPESAADQARQTYAAVVSHLDSELGSFLDFVRGRAEWEQSLVVITSDCGATLDDPQTVTLDGNILHEGRTHVPLLIRMPGARDPAARSPALVQPIDLMPTVCDAMDVAIPTDVHGRSLLPIVRLQSRAVRDHALMADAGCAWAIRTPAWHLILPSTASDSEALPEPRLFIKPDDRWDQNDVAKQYPDVAEQLTQSLRTHMGSSC